MAVALIWAPAGWEVPDLEVRRGRLVVERQPTLGETGPAERPALAAFFKQFLIGEAEMEGLAPASMASMGCEDYEATEDLVGVGGAAAAMTGLCQGGVERVDPQVLALESVAITVAS